MRGRARLPWWRSTPPRADRASCGTDNWLLCFKQAAMGAWRGPALALALLALAASLARAQDTLLVLRRCVGGRWRSRCCRPCADGAGVVARAARCRVWRPAPGHPPAAAGLAPADAPLPVLPRRSDWTPSTCSQPAVACKEYP